MLGIFRHKPMKDMEIYNMMKKKGKKKKLHITCLKEISSNTSHATIIKQKNKVGPQVG
jgi:hypothetical protein